MAVAWESDSKGHSRGADSRLSTSSTGLDTTTADSQAPSDQLSSDSRRNSSNGSAVKVARKRHARTMPVCPVVSPFAASDVQAKCPPPEPVKAGQPGFPAAVKVKPAKLKPADAQDPKDTSSSARNSAVDRHHDFRETQMRWPATRQQRDACALQDVSQHSTVHGTPARVVAGVPVNAKLTPEQVASIVGLYASKRNHLLVELGYPYSPAPSSRGASKGMQAAMQQAYYPSSNKPVVEQVVTFKKAGYDERQGSFSTLRSDASAPVRGGCMPTCGGGWGWLACLFSSKRA